MHEVRIAVNDRPMFLGSRGRANRLRHEVEAQLAASDDIVVVLDFSNVEGVSHGFADELLSPLTELLGERLPERVIVEGANDDVAEFMEIVADMHDLVLPTFREPADG